MNVAILSILEFMDYVLNLYIMFLVVWAILSWLITFGVVNRYSRAVQIFNNVADRITEPFLHPIRARLPVMGGVDLSPLVLFLIIKLIQYIIHNTEIRLALAP